MGPTLPSPPPPCLRHSPSLETLIWQNCEFRQGFGNMEDSCASCQPLYILQLLACLCLGLFVWGRERKTECWLSWLFVVCSKAWLWEKYSAASCAFNLTRAPFGIMQIPQRFSPSVVFFCVSICTSLPIRLFPFSLFLQPWLDLP